MCNITFFISSCLNSLNRNLQKVFGYLNRKKSIAVFSITIVGALTGAIGTNTLFVGTVEAATGDKTTLDQPQPLFEMLRQFPFFPINNLLGIRDIQEKLAQQPRTRSSPPLSDMVQALSLLNEGQIEILEKFARQYSTDVSDGPLIGIAQALVDLQYRVLQGDWQAYDLMTNLGYSEDYVQKIYDDGILNESHNSERGVLQRIASKGKRLWLSIAPDETKHQRYQRMVAAGAVLGPEFAGNEGFEIPFSAEQKTSKVTGQQDDDTSSNAGSSSWYRSWGPAQWLTGGLALVGGAFQMTTGAPTLSPKGPAGASVPTSASPFNATLSRNSTSTFNSTSANGAQVSQGFNATLNGTVVNSRQSYSGKAADTTVVVTPTPSTSRNHEVADEECTIRNAGSRRYYADQDNEHTRDRRYTRRSGTDTFRDAKWANGTVFYKWHGPSINANKRKAFTWAMERIQNTTCIKFKDVTHNANMTGGYVLLRGDRGYTADVGAPAPDRVKIASIGEDEDGYIPYGSAVHEIGHSLGFFHTHSRYDRDQYINIHWDRINTDKYQQFANEGDNTGTPYDYESVMHYYKSAYRARGVKKKLDTIAPNLIGLDLMRDAQRPVLVGQRNDLSYLDIIALRRGYECQLQNPSKYNITIDPGKVPWKLPPWNKTDSIGYTPPLPNENELVAGTVPTDPTEPVSRNVTLAVFEHQDDIRPIGALVCTKNHGCLVDPKRARCAKKGFCSKKQGRIQVINPSGLSTQLRHDNLVVLRTGNFLENEYMVCDEIRCNRTERRPEGTINPRHFLEVRAINGRQGLFKLVNAYNSSEALSCPLNGDGRVCRVVGQDVSRPVYLKPYYHADERFEPRRRGRR